MSARWTLPLLQHELDGLELGELFRLTREDMALLFGLNSAAVSRIANFANGHGCEVVFTAGDVVFRKTRKRKSASVKPSPTQGGRIVLQK